MEDFMKKIREENAFMTNCSNFLYEDVKNALNTNKLVGFEKLPSNKPSNNYCFRIKLLEDTFAYKNYNIRTISISIPPDTNRFRVHDATEQGINNTQFIIRKMYIIEIALMDKDNDITYKHPRCDNVLQYDSFDSLIKGIEEIRDYT